MSTLKKQANLNPYITKSELAVEVLGHNNFDTALPQQALNNLSRNNDEYELLRFGLVTNYENNVFGVLVAITADAQQLLKRV